MENNIMKIIEYYNQVKKYLDYVLVGENNAKKAITTALLCDKNCRILLTGNTGTGKTTIANHLANQFNSKRISITSDMIPSDIQEILKKDTTLEFLHPDEFNRASGKVQSSLIEILAENQMTIEDHIYKFPDFEVVATQNSSDIAGIFNVPQAVYDRFDMNVYLGNITRDELKEILFGDNHQEDCPNINLKEIINNTSQIVNNFVLSEADKDLFMKAFDTIDFYNYNSKKMFSGSNIRAHKFAIKTAKLSAMASGRDQILPTDIAQYITYIYMHRIDQNILKINDYKTNEQFENIKEKVLSIKK